MEAPRSGKTVMALSASCLALKDGGIVLRGRLCHRIFHRMLLGSESILRCHLLEQQWPAPARRGAKQAVNVKHE